MCNNFKEKNIVSVTNNNVKYYENLANRYSKESFNSAAKAAAYANEANEYLISCKNLKNTIDEETMQLVSLHSDKNDNPHEVTAAQVGAYSKTETDDLLTTKLAKKNPNLVAGQNIVITDNDDGTQTIKSSNTVSLDYTIAQNKPTINSVTLDGNKSSHDLGLAALSDLPTNVSELQNDSGYLTQHQDITGKQDVLSAGAGIALENNIVSTVNRVDTDLSNLTDSGKKVLDGQWIAKVEELSTATAVGTYTIDLSTYLPNDNYSYEVLFYANGSYGGGTDNTPRYTYIYTDDYDYSETPLLRVRASTNGNPCCTVVIPINIDRTVYYKLNAKLSNALFSALAYRRIGTNA